MRSITLLTSALVMCTLKLTLGNTCGGNCPTDSCTSCPCGTTPSFTNIGQACAQYAQWSQSCCLCIVGYASNGNLNAAYYNVGNRTYDVGLWQIGQHNWPSCSNGSAPCSFTANLNCAIKMFQFGGNTWKNWGSCADCVICGDCPDCCIAG